MRKPENEFQIETSVLYLVSMRSRSNLAVTRGVVYIYIKKGSTYFELQEPSSFFT